MEAPPSKEAPNRARYLLIVGLAAFWPSLHTSPYYPLSVTSAFADGGALAISPHHTLYSLLVVLFFVAALLVRKRAVNLVPYATRLAALAGVLGTVGTAVLAFRFLPGGAVEGLALACVAVYVSSFFMTWLLLAAREDIAQAPILLLSSYALFCLVWMAVNSLLPGIVSVFLMACPAVSAMCLCAYLAVSNGFGQLADGTIRTFPWPLIALCLVFVYFGVTVIRVFTSMEKGQAMAGGTLALLPTLASTATAFVITAIAMALLKKKGYTPMANVVGFALITMVYVASLLVILVADPSSQAMLLSKRVLVGAEHCFEVLLALVAVYQVGKQGTAGIKAFALLGIFVFVLPQFVSFDLLTQTGALALLATFDYVAPIAAIAAFAIMMGVVVFLLRYSTHATAKAQEAAEQASKQGEDWQHDLCRRATESFGLTERELEVVELTYRGHSAKRIAEELLVSESTVKAHLSHAYRKMDVHSKQDLIAQIDSFR